MNQPNREVTAVIVGGAGAMGRWAVRAIAGLGSVDRLIVADRDLLRAQKITDEVGGPCEAMELDATDPVALRDMFGECDVVLSTMGPFSIFARAVVDAAIESGCHYLDIDDDWQSTVEADEYDEAAREAGCTIVKGIGGSPGVSNLLAVEAGRRLDTVEAIVTGWSMRGAVLEDEPDYPSQARAGAATEHWILQVTGTARGWRDGAPADTRPLEPVDLDYPGIGRVRAHTVGHPEAVTLPRRFPGVDLALNLVSGPDWIFDYTHELAAAYEAGQITLKEAAHRFENGPSRPSSGRRDPLGQVWATAYGTRAGKAMGISVAPTAAVPGKMGGVTGTALAVGLELFLRHSETSAGVLFPEHAFDSSEFFDMLAGLTVPATSADTLLEIHEQIDAMPPSFRS